MTKEAELVFISPPRVSHVAPAIELAKLITERHPNLSATVLMMRLPGEKTPVPESRNPRLKLVVLQREESHSPLPGTAQRALFHQVNQHMPDARRVIAEMSRSSGPPVAGIIADLFCIAMIVDVAREFGIPSYLFLTTSAAFLGLMLHMQSLRDDFRVDLAQYEDSDAEIIIPTYVNPVSARVLPRVLFEKHGGGDVFLNHATRYKETKGILINTFQDLESHALGALVNDATMPPVYAIGPVFNHGHHHADQTGGTFILKWLDLHPDSSVVFLCFGSMATFCAQQVREFALALENSGCRFLWCLRKPSRKGVVGCTPDDYENLEHVLPEGFLERTSEVGKVVGWTPQVEVLAHPAIGGFVSHCGWNSTLESIWCGVPMAVLPIYAEQQMNSFQMVNDLGIAVDIKMEHAISLGCESEMEDGTPIVGAHVIQGAIKKLMDPRNNCVRKKAKEMQNKSLFTLGEEGTSYASLKCFLKNVMDNVC